MANNSDKKVQAVFTLNVIPTKISQLINDLGFTTKTSELENDAEFITKDDIEEGTIIVGPTKISQLENDTGFITDDEVDSKIESKVSEEVSKIKKMSYKIIESED